MRVAMGSWMETGLPARPDDDGAVGAAMNVAGLEDGDEGEGLGVEHDQGSGDAVVDGDGVVGHEAAGDGPTFLGVDDGAERLGRRGGDQIG
jgi:hypothetical protein